MEVGQFYAKDRAAWRAWLSKNHDKAQSIWLVYDKGKDRKLDYEEIVLEALCYGWVDSTAGTVSDTQAKIYVARRKPRSAWAKTNKARVEKLMAAGLMQPAGLQSIEIAKTNGAWDALNKSDNLELPPELINLLARHPAARKNFEAFPPSSKKLILEWIYSAKQDITRQKRVTETVELAEQNIRAHHYRQ